MRRQMERGGKAVALTFIILLRDLPCAISEHSTCLVQNCSYTLGTRTCKQWSQLHHFTWLPVSQQAAAVC